MKLKLPLLTALLGLSLLGSAASAKLQVMTTFTVLDDITKNIAGKYADVQSLTAIGAEIHEYQPTARDLVRLNRSDLIITNGLGLEKWFQRFYEKASKRIPTVDASVGVTPIYITSGPYKGKPNPHGWMSIKNAYIYIDNITKALQQHDPKNAAHYADNAKAYVVKIKKMENDVNEFLSKNNLKGDYLFTSESAFSYIARDIGLEYNSIFPVNAEEVGTPQQIARAVNIVRDNNVKVVFSGSTMDIKPMNVVIKETGAKFGGYLYVDTLTDKSGPVPTYLDMLSKTVYTIVDGYNKYGR